MPLTKLLLAGFVFSFVAAGVLKAQDDLPTLTVQAKLVVLDVVVTDAKNQVVQGLKRDDFTLLQDTKPQQIRSFEDHTETYVPKQVTDEFGRVSWGITPLTIFVLDALNTPFEEQSYAAHTLELYLKRQPAQLATPASLLLVTEQGVRQLAAYTQDRDLLLHALQHRPAALPAKLMRSANLELLADSFSALRQIALSAEGSHAHKSLVWLGRGFPSLDRHQFDEPGNRTLDAAVEDTVTLLTSARVTLYKVDPISSEARLATADMASAMVGMAVGDNSRSGAPTSGPLAAGFTFGRFAALTGGQSLYGGNDLDRLIAESLDRGAHFYTLSFVPTGGAESFRRVTIQMRDPALHATTREGFYAAGRAPKEVGFDLKLAATGTMQYEGVAVRIAGSTIQKGHATVRFAVEDRSLTWHARANGSEAAHITAMLTALDAGRRIVATTSLELDLAAKSPQETQRGTLRTLAEVRLNPRARFLRLVVRDASGRIGTAETPIEH